MSAIYRIRTSQHCWNDPALSSVVTIAAQVTCALPGIIGICRDVEIVDRLQASDRAVGSRALARRRRRDGDRHHAEHQFAYRRDRGELATERARARLDPRRRQ